MRWNDFRIFVLNEQLGRGGQDPHNGLINFLSCSFTTILAMILRLYENAFICIAVHHLLYYQLHHSIKV